jgi:hypothetical protein
MGTTRPTRKRSALKQPFTLTTRQVNTVAETVAEKLAFHTNLVRSSDIQGFMQRFDTIDEHNTDIKTGLTKHIEDDAKVHKVVEQHKTYWGITIKVLLGLIGGGFALFITWLGMH